MFDGSQDDTGAENVQRWVLDLNSKPKASLDGRVMEVHSSLSK